MTEFKTSDLAALEVTEVLKLARRLEKNKPDLSAFPSLRIAILGSRNTQFFTKVLTYFLIQAKFDPIIYEGEYDSIVHEITADDSGLAAFGPEILILLPVSGDLRRFPAVLDSENSVDALVNETAGFYVSLWDKVLARMSCMILQANFVIDLEAALDQMEINAVYSKTVFLQKLNLALLERKPKQVHLIDENGLASEVGKRLWFDPVNEILNKAPYAYAFLPIVAEAYLRKILSLKGQSRKVLVLDLDNTLWGGVIGDDGIEGIQLDPATALGEAYLAFQSYVLRLKEKGVILAVCSKNNDEIAKQAFSHPNMKIKLTDITCFIANWEDKASNLRRIADRLNVKTDALVFFDDNPAERSIVRDFLPEILVVDVPDDPALYRIALVDAHPFDWSRITQEDILRNKAFEDDVQRDQLRHQVVDYDAYLASLEMKAQAGRITNAQIERFVQLTNKSNQFNLRTQRYTEAQIMALHEDRAAALIAVDLSDRFSPYGIIACIVLRKQGDEAFIENWVMSCRVLNRGVEDLSVALCARIAMDMGCTTLVGEYLSTPKNGLVKDQFLKSGFTLRNDGKYSLALDRYVPKPCPITLKENP